MLKLILRAPRQTRDHRGIVAKGLLLGPFGIFLILSFQFRSYIEPVIVMISVPVAFLGAIRGHEQMGVFGLLVSTVVVLIALPALYVLDEWAWLRSEELKESDDEMEKICNHGHIVRGPGVSQ